MEALTHNVKPKNVHTSRPGPVGSLGVTIVKPRFRNSNANMPIRFDPYWDGARGNTLGSNVTDGQWKSYDDGGGPARTYNARWTGNRSFKHQYGWRYHNIAPVAKFCIPELTPQGDVSWRDKIAVTRHVRQTGRMFLVQPYGLKGVLRNGMYPTATSHGGDQGPFRPGTVTEGLQGEATPPVPGQSENLANRAGIAPTGQRQNAAMNAFNRVLRL